MNIVSLQFVLLAAASLLLFYLVNQKYRTALLILFSLGFIASFSFLMVGYIIVFSVFNYLLGLKIAASESKAIWYRTGLAINIAQLGLLKYSSFAIDPIFRLVNSGINLSWLAEVLIPVGISYFTLQGIGYLINVKMGWEKPENRFQYFLLILSFSPSSLPDQ